MRRRRFSGGRVALTALRARRWMGPLNVRAGIEKSVLGLRVALGVVDGRLSRCCDASYFLMPTRCLAFKGF